LDTYHSCRWFEVNCETTCGRGWSIQYKLTIWPLRLPIYLASLHRGTRPS
jgi:hypothetical protein